MQRLIEPVDQLLNQIAMYRLVVYTLRILVALGVVVSFLGLLPFSPFALLFSALFLVVLGWVVNLFFAKALSIPANVESYTISALILTLIISPPVTLWDVSFLFWAGVLTIGSKFIVALHKKHIFNPVALGVAITALTLSQSANWWVGSRVMLPFVFVLGFLVVRKVRRFAMVGTFLVAALFGITMIGIFNGAAPWVTLEKVIFDSPLIFFAAIMLTEPFTTPPTQGLRIVYGGLVGFLFAPQLHIGTIYSTPELALLVGNLFSYIVSPKTRMILTLKEKLQLTPDVWDFVFIPDQKLKFTAGQYLEWTINPEKQDNRGNRRYFTIASAPTENTVRLGIKMYENSSSFKKSLLLLAPGDKIVASQLAGDFILPKEENKKYVFIAGGIGVTPYRSIIKDLIDNNKQKDIVLLYADKNEEEFVYTDLFKEAKDIVGLKTVYIVSEEETVKPGWQGRVGRIDSTVIKEEVPDYKERSFYISGSHAVVVAMEKALHELGIPSSQIKTDFFPGFV